MVYDNNIQGIDIKGHKTFDCPQVIKHNMLELGFGGWMADFGEYLPVDALLHSGEARLLHNQWPRLWARLNHQAVTEMGRAASDVLFFSRSGFSGRMKLLPSFFLQGDFSLSDHCLCPQPS